MINIIKNNKEILLFVLTFFIIFSVQNKMISNSLPYPMHIDEARIVSTSINIMKTGDFNPHFFNYPSLPIYLTTVGATVGLFKSASNLEIRKLKNLSADIYPYFKYPTVIKYPKALFVIFSSFVFIFLMLIIKNIYPSSKYIMFFFVPILLISEEFMIQSWQYLNVNIIGAFFIIVTIFYILQNKEKDSYLVKVIIPSILIGAAIASKYNFFLLIVPVILAILFYSKTHKILKLLLILPISIFTFIILTPYSILDFSKFLTDVSSELWHYKYGHSGYNAVPGVNQLIYYIESISNQFTLPLTILGIVGMLKMLKDNHKDFLIIISFPILLLIFMSSQKVHFIRNIISIYAIYAIFIFLGLFLVWSVVKKIDTKKYYIIFSILLAMLLTQPIYMISQNLKRLYVKESRNVMSDWIQNNIELKKKIYVSKDLNFNLRDLKKIYSIKEYERKEIENLDLEKGDYIIIPIYGYDHRKIAGKKVAEDLNKKLDNLQLKKLYSIGKNEVLVNYHITVPSGEPKMHLSIYR